MKCSKPTVIITSNLFKPSIGGVENSLHHLSLAYIELGYQPIIVVSDLSINDDILPAYELSDGIHIYRYSMSKKRKLFGLNLPKPISGILNAISLYKKINIEYQPTLLIARYHFNQLFAKLAGIRNTIYLVPGVVKFQNSAKHITKSNFKSRVQWHYHIFLQYWAFKFSDRIAVFSQNMIQQVNVIKKQKQMPLLTKPGVDMKRFFPINFEQKLILREQLKYPCKGKVFLCVGRSVKAKGIDIAINAFAQLKNTHHQLWIVGDGPLVDQYKDQARALGITFQVVFHGVQSQPEYYYRAADFFLMSSVYEPLGQTILEGLSSGLPIIAFQPSDNVETATAELVNDEHAIFIDRPCADLLGKVMIDVSTWSESEYHHKSQCCRAHAVKHFSWESLAQTLVEEFLDEK
jgi:glycosyltransferase involved in cell wall biosynthesis